MKKIIILVSLLIPATLFAQGSYFRIMSPEVVDARSTAMGRTSVVSARGSNAIFSNPALLAADDQRHIIIGGRALFGSVEPKYIETTNDLGETRYLKITTDFPLQFGAPNFSFSLPYILPDPDFRISAGFGYFTFLDHNREIEYNFLGSDVNEDFSAAIYTFVPGIAIN